jgi:hypothetical protein
MGWEKRHNNQEYYYRKIRQGRKVISQYIGRRGEPVAELAAALDAAARRQRDTQTAPHPAPDRRLV